MMRPIRSQPEVDAVWASPRRRARRDRRSEALGVIRRYARTAAEYAAEGDEAELVEFTELLVHIERCRDYVAVTQHERGKAWAALGEAFGVTRQAVHKRWANLNAANLATSIGIATSQGGESDAAT